MVTKRKIPKKKLKQPDEFIAWGSQAMNYAVAHLRYIGLGVVLVGVIILALFLWRQHVTVSEEMAFTLLGRGINLYHQGEKRGEALQVFTEVIRDHPRTKAGKIALLYRGRCYVSQRDHDLALTDYNLFLKKSSGTFLRVIALNAQGNSYRAKGEYQRALDSFQQVLASREEWLKPTVLLSIGMCWEKLGEAKKASDAYQESLKLSPSAPWATLARLRVKKLKEKDQHPSKKGDD